MKTSVWLLPFLALPLLDCGSSKKSDFDPAFVPAVDYAQARAMIERGSVTCDVEQGKCPEAVGLLALAQTTKEGFGVELCTATLIAPHVVATNAHCIPPDLRFDGEACRGRGRFLLPSLPGKPAETAGCGKVLRSSRLLTAQGTYIQVSPDYAFVELDRPVTTRALITPSFEGLDDELPVSIYKADPVDGRSVRSKITLTKCVVTQGTVVDLQFNDKFRRIGTLTRCEGRTPVQHGNSGSVVLDSASRARALLQGGSEGQGPERVLVTNLACIPAIPGFGRPLAELPAACSVTNGADERQDPKELEPALTAWLMRDLLRSALQRWQAAHAAALKVFKYEVRVRPDGASFEVLPRCYQGAAVAALTGPAPKIAAPAGIFRADDSTLAPDLRGFVVSLRVERESSFNSPLPRTYVRDAGARNPLTLTWAGGDAEIRAQMPTRLPICENN